MYTLPGSRFLLHITRIPLSVSHLNAGRTRLWGCRCRWWHAHTHAPAKSWSFGPLNKNIEKGWKGHMSWEPVNNCPCFYICLLSKKIAAPGFLKALNQTFHHCFGICKKHHSTLMPSIVPPARLFSKSFETYRLCKTQKISSCIVRFSNVVE